MSEFGDSSYLMLLMLAKMARLALPAMFLGTIGALIYFVVRSAPLRAAAWLATTLQHALLQSAMPEVLLDSACCGVCTMPTSVPFTDSTEMTRRMPYRVSFLYPCRFRVANSARAGSPGLGRVFPR